jgi:hypothetical protein
MSEIVKLGVLLLPSPTETAWREALLEAADRAGYSVSKSVSRLSSTNLVGHVLIVSDAAEAHAFGDANWVVLTTDLQTAADTMLERMSHAVDKGYKLLAGQLAAQAWLLDNGAQSLDSSSEALEFPGLGRLIRPARVSVPSPPADIGPLAVYAQPIPAPGAAAEWPMGVFVFKNPVKLGFMPPNVDLTGRGRVVVYGPRYALPSGRWRITARFAVDTEDSDLYLKFEWGVGEDLETLEVMLQKSGGYEVVLDHAWAFPGQAELRVWASNAHFVGRMEFHGGRVERLPDICR